jgi:hypothetical protein
VSVLLSPRIDAKRREWTSIVFIRVDSRDGRAFSILISSLGVSGCPDFVKVGHPGRHSKYGTAKDAKSAKGMQENVGTADERQWAQILISLAFICVHPRFLRFFFRSSPCLGAASRFNFPAFPWRSWRPWRFSF